MTIMVTGGAGFVGLNLAEALLARGEHVVVVSRDPVPGPAAQHFATLPGTWVEAILDVRQTDQLAALMRTHRVDALFPFAAITSSARREALAPEEVIDVNLLGFIAQLRAARDAGVRRIVAPASGAVYGESFYQRALLDEATTPCLPTGIYGVTKYAVERSALRLASLWDLDIVVARIGSVFGPWEHDTGLRDLLTPHWALARAAVAGEHAVLPRDIPDYAWIYSADVASALLHLLDLEHKPHRVFNICSGQNWGSVITQWADRLAQDHPDFTWRQSTTDQDCTIPFSEALPRGRMDIARIQATGWAPAYSPKAAYEAYAEWLARHPDAL
jgi:nucleoside-diphosphate-sugar epimerase